MAVEAESSTPAALPTGPAARALDAPGAHPRVEADHGSFTLPPTALGLTGVYAGAVTLPSGTAFRCCFRTPDGTRLLPLPEVEQTPRSRTDGQGRAIASMKGA